MLGTDGFEDLADFAPEVKANSTALKCALESILTTELHRTSRG